MKTTEHLFYLIRSLSKAEKRSFKLFAKQYSKDGTNNYTILFDAIDKMQTYDHNALVKGVKNKINTKNISTLKVQLSELILKSLRQHSASFSENLKLRQDIDYIDILFEKGLYPQAKKLLEKAFELARNQENYLAMDRLSLLEFNIAIKQSNKEDLDHYVEVTFPEVSLARKNNDILAEFEYLAAKMRICLLEGTSFVGTVTRQRLTDIIEHPLMNVEIDKYPKQCQMDFHVIWGHYHYAFDHPKEMYFHRKQVVEIIVEKRNWLTHARFLLIGLSTFKMFKEFDLELEIIMKTINEIPQQNRNSSFLDELDHTLNNININRDMDQGNYSKILTYLSDLEEKYTEPSLQIYTNLKMVFYFNFTYAHLATCNYKKALKWSNEILNNPEMRNIRLDGNCYLRLMLICIHYGLGNHELIRPLVKSAQRYLKKQEREIEMLTSFMRFANNNFIEPYKDSKKATFDEQVANLERLSQEEDGKIAMEYFNFLAWLKSMYTEQSMQEVEEELLVMN
jgi:tetratricopeptide (TPR) repeat protein